MFSQGIGPMIPARAGAPASQLDTGERKEQKSNMGARESGVAGMSGGRATSTRAETRASALRATRG